MEPAQPALLECEGVFDPDIGMDTLNIDTVSFCCFLIVYCNQSFIRIHPSQAWVWYMFDEFRSNTLGHLATHLS